MDNREEQMKKALKGLAENTEKAASVAKDKIARQMESENVKKATRAAARNAKNASSGAVDFWKKLSRRGKILAGILAVIVVCVLFSGGNGLMTGGKKVTSEEKGEKLVKELYPDSTYQIEFMETGIPYTAFFNVGKGEFCSKGKSAEKIKIYVYMVTRYSPPGTAQLWVAEDGKIIGSGNLVNNSFPDEWIRLR